MFFVDDKEFEGVSVEEAVNKALISLNTSRDKIDVKVICEESKGLFGMKGSKTAKIRVSLKK